MRTALALAAAAMAMAAQAAAGEPLPDGALPDAVVAAGDGPVRRAWLAEPTDRYGHGILGDRIEAGALMAELADGRTLGLRLPRSSVFEDRYVRLADFNGDGVDEMVVVESDLREGAALAIYGVREGRLQLVARDRWIGTRNRWLNPAGIADFDGDGELEIAIVVTPHIGGTLKLLSPEGGTMRTEFSEYGYSNHPIGSRDQHLSAVVDWNGDGRPDLAVPDAARTAVHVLSFGGGGARRLASFDLPRPAAGDFETVEGGDGPVIRVPLAGGGAAEIQPAR